MTRKAHKVAFEKMGLNTFLIEYRGATRGLHSITKKLATNGTCEFAS
jgi:hypothetical protein